MAYKSRGIAKRCNAMARRGIAAGSQETPGKRQGKAVYGAELIRHGRAWRRRAKKGNA